jgi:hypothetical protein
MTRNQAIKTARKAVSDPIGRGTSWRVFGPYHASEPHGASTEITASSFFHARAKRTEWVAYIALVQMGLPATEADVCVSRAHDDGFRDVVSIVKHCAEALK